MTSEALLSYAHILAILTLIVFRSSPMWVHSEADPR